MSSTKRQEYGSEVGHDSCRIVLIDMWNVISEVGKAEMKQKSMEAKGHNSDCRTKRERESDHVL